MKTKKVITFFVVLMLLVCLAIPGMTAFAKTTDNGLVYSVVNGNSVKITGYIGEETEIVIPSEIDGYPVTNIISSAFCDYDKLLSVTIPDTVTIIGDYAFGDCSYLKSVTLGNSVESIGYGAFESCGRLESIVIPNSVKSIEEYAFYYCTALNSAIFEDSAVSIADRAFYYCYNLTTLELGDYVKSIGDYAFWNCDKLTSINIPDSTTSIGKEAFYRCGALKSAFIGNSVETIGDFAFYNCSSLTNVMIGDSVTSIGNSAFCGCGSLSRISMGDSLEHIGDSAFYSCVDLISITIPEAVKTIGNSAFTSCTSLKNIVIPNSVTSLGSNAFSACTALRSVVIGDSVSSIPITTFYRCKALQSIEVSENNESYCDVDGNLFNKEKTELIQYSLNKSNADYTIPDTVVTVRKYAFYEINESLKRIVIPDSVTSIEGGYNFLYLNSSGNVYERNITLYVTSDSYAHTYAKSNGFSYVATEAAPTPAPTPTPSSGVINGFGYNIIENSYAEITSYSGEETEISIPYEINGYAVKSIGNDAFCDCTALTKVIIPNGITNIGDGAFYNCSSLKSIIIPEGTEKIGSYAFYECAELAEATIPSSVKNMGEAVFFGCNNLVIYGVNASYAQNYAVENGIKFIDMNGSGVMPSKNVLYAGYSVERSIINNKKLPRYVTLEGEKIYMPEMIGVFARFIIDANIDFNGTTLVERNAVSFAETSCEQITGDTLTKAQYVQLAQDVIEYMVDNSTAPGYVKTDAGTLSYETTLKVFAEIVSYARAEKKLPETVAVQAWVTALPTPPSEDASDISNYIPFADILSGAEFAKTATESTGEIPTYVVVNNNRLYRGTMLSMFVKTIVGIEQDKLSAVPLKEITVPVKTVSETITSCTLTKAEYLILAARIANAIDSMGALPKYCTTTYGTINTNNMIYVFSKVLDSYNTNGTLPETIDIQPWGTYEF